MTNVTFDLVHYDSVGSTNDEARRLAEAGAAHGTVVVAREQTAGRGRNGRRWVSPPGNLHLSILLRVGLTASRLTVSRLAELGFVAALAVAGATDAFAPGRAMLKWPNDVLVDGAKLSGILLEPVAQAVIVGIGINVLHVPLAAPYPVTSLALIGNTGATVDAARSELLDAFARWFGLWQRVGFDPVRAAWLSRAHPIGTGLRVTTATEVISGCFGGLADNGALLLNRSDGARRIVAGDVMIWQQPPDLDGPTPRG
ncbi:MAG TPA: biotin--[acetyl-CoA-carboxylase] ligase [Acetobacteraceae bacterium]|nr:biotin--[acetyl-CoA-carboxylase] ligase [Acetobacteraceae bacterium]